MNYPLISEYVDAIKSAEDNFEELSYLRPVLGDDGLPVMTSGNFAVVFKMRDERDGKLYAVKCFTKEQEGRAEAYREIAKELKQVSSPYILSIQYLEKELFVDTDQTTETEFPVLLMEWIEGKTLDKYLRENLDDKYALDMLAYRFSKLAQWLIPQHFAHGDLKPDNILVREDGSLVLVDYDGMYVPAMKGQKARELGSPDFRHPLRTENDFDEHIDDFPLVSILLSLKAISQAADLHGIINDFQNQLLFSESDYLNIFDCKVIRRIFSLNEPDINKLTVAFLYYVVNSAKARYPILILLNYGYSPELTIIKDRYYSLSNKYIDEYGVEYSRDKRILLRWHSISSTVIPEIDFPASYNVYEGTEIICEDAFMHCKSLTTLYLPKSLKYIGKSAFVGTSLSEIQCDSSLFTSEDNILYSYDKRVLYYYPKVRKDTVFEVPEQVKKIIKGCFLNAKYLCIIKLKHIQYDFEELDFDDIFLSVPKGTKKYLDKAYQNYCIEIDLRDEGYYHCYRTNIFEGDLIVENGVIYSSDKTILYRFPYWLDIEEYHVDEKCKIIETTAFDDSYGMDDYGQSIQFNKLKSLYLPKGLEEIKDYAFVGCGYLENLTIPPSVNRIGNYVFGQCVNLTTLTFLSKIDNIKKESFDVGETMPGHLVNPYFPYVLLGWKKNEVDIVICPSGTVDYYKDILDSSNSLVYQLDKDEKQIKLEWPNTFNDKNYLIEPSENLKIITSPHLREQLKDIVFTKHYSITEVSFGIDLSKLKPFLGEMVFDAFKKTTRFFGQQNISGICYVTRNFRSRFISDCDSFVSYDDAIDFACRIYYDVYGNVLDLDIE